MSSKNIEERSLYFQLLMRVAQLWQDGGDVLELIDGIDDVRKTMVFSGKSILGILELEEKELAKLESKVVQSYRSVDTGIELVVKLIYDAHQVGRCINKMLQKNGKKPIDFYSRAVELDQQTTGGNDG